MKYVHTVGMPLQTLRFAYLPDERAFLSKRPFHRGKPRLKVRLIPESRYQDTDIYRQSQSGVTIVGLGWFSPTDRKTFAVYRVFDTEGATFSRFSQRIRG